MGDSITEGYAIYELNRGRTDILNRGINGSTSKDILANLDALISGLEPRKLFLLIGTNDLSENKDIPEVSRQIFHIIEGVKNICLEIKVYLQSVYPVNSCIPESPARYVDKRNNRDICALNELLRKGCSGNTEFVDVYPLLLDEKGDLKSEYTYDGLHLSVKGYQAVNEQLYPLFDE